MKTTLGKAHKAAVELSQCRGKKSLDFERAKTVARRSNRNGDKDYQPYRCKECGRFHVGNTKGANYRLALQQKRLKAKEILDEREAR